MEWQLDITDSFAFIASIVFLTLAFIQLVWLLFFYSRVAFHQYTPSGNRPPVSVIIAARNEEDNLFKLLPKILQQDYYDFEVIVVNHQSNDDSNHILKAIAREHKHLKIIEIEKNKHLKPGKKLPLTVAIKGAKHEHLLFTDADCEPSSNKWLELMASQFTSKHEIVLGYGPYRKKPGLLNKIIRYDTFFIALNYLSFAKAKIPYMGVGRNMGYTKSIFLKNNGFKSHYSIQSGDDDLFIQEVAKKGNYTTCITPKAFCYSDPEEDWGAWFRQKSRHFTTTERYQVIKKLLLGIYPQTLLLLYISFLTLCWNNLLCWTTISVFFFVFILKWWIFGKALYRLQEKEFVWLLPFWDLFYAILAPIVYYSTEKSIDAKWK